MFKNRYESGSAIIITIITISILLVLNLAIMPLSIIQLKSSQSFHDYQKCYFLAEAGMEEAVAILSESKDWDYIYKWDNPLGDGIYSVTISGDQSKKEVVSTGSIGNISRSLKTIVSKNPGQNSNELSISEWREID